MDWKFWKKKEPEKPVHHHDWIVIKDSACELFPYPVVDLTKDFPEFIDLFEGSRHLIKRDNRFYIQIRDVGHAWRPQDKICATCEEAHNGLSEYLSTMIDYHLKYTSPDKMSSKIEKVNQNGRKILLKTINKYAGDVRADSAMRHPLDDPAYM